MPDMTPAASGQTIEGSARTQPVDCAYLHNAFGPGCPHCWQAADPATGAERLRDRADSSTPHWVRNDLDQAEIIPHPGPDFRAVA